LVIGPGKKHQGDASQSIAPSRWREADRRS